MGHHRERVERHGAAGVAQRVVEPAERAGGHARDVVGRHVARFQLDRAREMPLARRVVESVLPEGPAPRGMGLGQFRRQHERPLAAGQRQLAIVGRLGRGVEPEDAVALGAQGPGSGVAGALRRELLEQPQGLGNALRRPRVPVVACAKKLQVGLVRRRAGLRGPRVAASHAQQQRLTNPGRQLLLAAENVAFAGLVAVGPPVEAAGGIDELHRRAHAAAAPADASLDQRRHVQAAADLPDIGGPSLERGRRGPGDDAQVGGAGQFAGQFFGEAVGEVLLRGIAAEVRERQHDDRCGGGRLRPEPPGDGVSSLGQIEHQPGIKAGAGIVFEQLLAETTNLDAHGRVRPRIEVRGTAEGLGRDGVLLGRGLREGALHEVPQHRR